MELHRSASAVLFTIFPRRKVTSGVARFRLLSPNSQTRIVTLKGAYIALERDCCNTQPTGVKVMSGEIVQDHFRLSYVGFLDCVKPKYGISRAASLFKGPGLIAVDCTRTFLKQNLNVSKSFSKF